MVGERVQVACSSSFGRRVRAAMMAGRSRRTGCYGCLSFGHAATDAGLHRLAVILTAAGAGLLAGTLADRKLAAARPRPR